MKQTLMKALILVMSLMSANLIAIAQDDDEWELEIRRTLELSNSKELCVNVFSTAMNSIARQDSTIASMELNWNEISEELIDSIYSSYSSYMMNIYRQNFTLEEIKQMNAYLASPVGQKAQKITPYLMSEGMKFFESEKIFNTYMRVLRHAIERKSVELHCVIHDDEFHPPFQILVTLMI